MNLLKKERLFGSYSLVLGKTFKVLNKASVYLPKDFSALIKVLNNSSITLEKHDFGAEDYVINAFYRPLLQRLDKLEFENYKQAFKAAMISKSITNLTNTDDYKEIFLASIVRDLPITVLRNEDKETYKKFELKVIEGKSIEEAAMLCYGVSLEQYVEQFAKHFNYSFVDEKQEEIVEFCHYLAESFSDKEKKASSLWLESQALMSELGIEISEDKWANLISNLFVKTLEFEQKFK